jgi:hypothetical protein
MERVMSLPLPVFRLESPRDLPFEPLCAVSTVSAREPDEVAGSLIERFRLWLVGERARMRGREAG